MSTEFKEEVYMLAGVSIEASIKLERETLHYWKSLRENYPISPGRTSAINHCSPADVEVSVARSKVDLKNKQEKLLSVQNEVEMMVTMIYKTMSDFDMTTQKVRKISQLLNEFMLITGKPWIRGVDVNRWSVFLLENWGEYLIPHDREEVWTRIPLLAATFMHKFNQVRDAGERMPAKYPPEDGYIGRNMPHIEQECCESR